MVIDAPPGTSDEHLSIVQFLSNPQLMLNGAILVTTPQEVALQVSNLFIFRPNLSVNSTKLCRMCEKRPRFAKKWKYPFWGWLRTWAVSCARIVRKSRQYFPRTSRVVEVDAFVTRRASGSWARCRSTRASPAAATRASTTGRRTPTRWPPKPSAKLPSRLLKCVKKSLDLQK